MESANWTPDYSVCCLYLSTDTKHPTANTSQTAPVPEGRNANGCRQKINKIKIALKPELDALKAGEAIADPAPASPTKKPTTPRKRKTKTDEDGTTSEATPKKARGRPKKKAVTPEAEEDPENIVVKGEYEGMEADA